MRNILLEEKYILECIRDILNDYKLNSVNVLDAKYHHNASYNDASLIIKHGILSLFELNKLGIKKYSNDILKIMDDVESHVNGSSAVSLAVVGMDDLYSYEDEYDPYSLTQVDFLVSSDLRACRSSIHYGNEFLVYNKIKPYKIRAVDIRLLKHIDLIIDRDNFLNSRDCVRLIVNNYNCLRKMALSLKQMGLDAPIREMSYDDNVGLDIDKIIKGPRLILKR